MEPKLLFNDRSRPLIFEALEFTVRAEDGIIVNKIGDPVLDIVDKMPVHIDDLAGIHTDGLIKSDLYSIIKLVDHGRV